MVLAVLIAIVFVAADAIALWALNQTNPDAYVVFSDPNPPPSSHAPVVRSVVSGVVDEPRARAQVLDVRPREELEPEPRPDAVGLRRELGELRCPVLGIRSHRASSPWGVTLMCRAPSASAAVGCAGRGGPTRRHPHCSSTSPGGGPPGRPSPFVRRRWSRRYGARSTCRASAQAAARAVEGAAAQARVLQGRGLVGLVEGADVGAGRDDLVDAVEDVVGER